MKSSMVSVNFSCCLWGSYHPFGLFLSFFLDIALIKRFQYFKAHLQIWFL